jgi:N-acetylglucosamine-6-phosphate deacetylase
MMEIVLRNGRCVFPDGIRDGLEVLIRDGRIVDTRTQTHEPNDNVIDLAGNYLAPGFVDLHLHGAVGHDAMEATEEAFRAICDYHITGGTTSLLLTTVSAPMGQITDALKAVRELRSRIAPLIGVHVEGPFIAKTKCGAQRQEFICEPTAMMTNQLLEFSDVIKCITLAPEVNGALHLMDRLRERKIRVSGGHSDAWEEEARTAFEHGMQQVTHTFNCMSSARHRGIYRVAGLLEFALSESRILCELIADGHHVSTTLIKMLYRAKGPDGICLVTDATAGAGLPNESKFTLGGRECLVSKGVCLLADRSALAGSAARMIDLLRTMVRTEEIPLPEAVAMATQNPARALGLDERKGSLSGGADADLVVFSPELDVMRTFVGGREVYTRR